MNFSPERLPKSVQRLMEILHVDFDPPRQPSTGEVVFASLVAIVGSLVADMIIATIATRVFPSTRGYAHFQFSDYAKLTVIGVVIACVGWPITSRITSRPKWLFLRMAVVVTVVLLAPDAAIWYLGQPAKAVIFLVLMHLAIAVVTYKSLVVLAPARRQRHVRR
jgi:hypothetical protein